MAAYREARGACAAGSAGLLGASRCSVLRLRPPDLGAISPRARAALSRRARAVAARATDRARVMTCQLSYMAVTYEFAWSGESTVALPHMITRVTDAHACACSAYSHCCGRNVYVTDRLTFTKMVCAAKSYAAHTDRWHGTRESDGLWSSDAVARPMHSL